MTKTRPFLSTCYGYPSTTEVPPCCQAATKKLTFSTTSVLLLLNVPLSLSRGTVFRRPKNPRRGSRPKIAGILFVCNEPEGKYYTVPNNITTEKPGREHPVIPATTDTTMIARGSTIHVIAAVARVHRLTPDRGHHHARQTPYTVTHAFVQDAGNRRITELTAALRGNLFQMR